jgi:hypothetical protein
LFIIHLNKAYVRDGDIDVEALFIKDDSTEQVDAKRAEIVGQMQAAKEFPDYPDVSSPDRTAAIDR